MSHNNSGTDRRTTFKIGRKVNHVTRDSLCVSIVQGQKIKGQGHKVSKTL